MKKKIIQILLSLQGCNAIWKASKVHSKITHAFHILILFCWYKIFSLSFLKQHIKFNLQFGQSTDKEYLCKISIKSLTYHCTVQLWYCSNSMQCKNQGIMNQGHNIWQRLSKITFLKKNYLIKYVKGIYFYLYTKIKSLDMPYTRILVSLL